MEHNTQPQNQAYNTILRQKYARDDQWITDFLTHAQIGHIATHWENQPFITPLIFWFDPEKKAIYFHTNVQGRLIENCTRYPEGCFETCEMGKLLPSNAAKNFGMQYASVVAFGKIFQLTDEEEKRYGLMGLLNKYFPDLKVSVDYRPILQKELDITAVLRFDIESWSGKKNWKEHSQQIPEWQELEESVLKKYLKQ